MGRADIECLPPHRSLPSESISITAAEDFLTRYLDRSETTPHLHPDAILSTAGVQFSLQGGPKGGITLHNLRRVQAGLRGEYIAPEIFDDADLDQAGDEQLAVAEGQDLNQDVGQDEDVTMETAPDAQHEVPAAPKDPVVGNEGDAERNMHDSGADPESSEEEDDPSRYISSAAVAPRQKGERRKEHRKKNAVSDDSRLDALIAEAHGTKKSKRKRDAEVVEEVKAERKEENDGERKKAKKEKRRADKAAKEVAKRGTNGTNGTLAAVEDDERKPRMLSADAEAERKRKGEKRARKEAKRAEKKTLKAK